MDLLQRHRRARAVSTACTDSRGAGRQTPDTDAVAGGMRAEDAVGIGVPTADEQLEL